MPARSSSANESSRLWLLVGIVASLVGLTLAGAGLSDSLLHATAVEGFKSSRVPPTTALVSAPTETLVVTPRCTLQAQSPRHAAQESRSSRRALWMPPWLGSAIERSGLTAWNRAPVPVPTATTGTRRGEGRHPFDTAPMSGGQGTQASPAATATLSPAP